MEAHMLARDEDILKAAEDWRKEGLYCASQQIRPSTSEMVG